MEYIKRVFGSGFLGYYNDSYPAKMFAKVIANDENLKSWTMRGEYFSEEIRTWENIGRVMAANTNLELLNLSFPTHMVAANPMSAFLTQLQANRSLRKLRIWGDTSSSISNDEFIRAFSSYLHCDNNEIVDISLIGFEFSSANFVGIASAVVGTKITSLCLDHCQFGHVDFGDASLAFNLLDQLKMLLMVDSESVKTMCKALCSALPAWSSLEYLSLEGNSLDDECCLMLGNALKCNTTLTEIDLKGNADMTGDGLEGLAPILCNGSTVKGIETSNHVVTVDFDDQEDEDVDEDDEADRECHLEGIRYLLSINKSSDSTASKVRRKIATVMFEGDFAVQRLAMMPVKLMPLTLNFLSHPDNKIAMKRKCSFAAMYHLIRNYDAAELFSFPSAERTRIEYLERKNSELLEEIRALKAENEDLKKESLRTRKKHKA